MFVGPTYASAPFRPRFSAPKAAMHLSSCDLCDRRLANHTPPFTQSLCWLTAIGTETGDGDRVSVLPGPNNRPDGQASADFRRKAEHRARCGTKL